MSSGPCGGEYVALQASIDVTDKKANRISGNVREGTGVGIWFYVFDTRNFNAWRAGQSFQPLAVVSNAVSHDFSFVPDRPDTYYFVLSNIPSFFASKAPSLSATWTFEGEKTREVTKYRTETRYEKVPLWR